MGLDVYLARDPASVALIVIDMQVDFLKDGGRMPIDRARTADLISHVNEAIARCQTRGALVVHVGNEFPRLSVANVFRMFAAIKGSPGAAIDPRVRSEGIIYLAKQHGDAFTNPDLNELLKRSGIETVLIAGVFANGCVRATTRGAVAHGFKTVVLADCVASRSDRSTTHALASMRSLGASVVATDERISA